MKQTITITKQWQFYIPEDIRQQINLTKPTRAMIKVKDDQIIIKPLKSKVLSLAGILAEKKPKKAVNIEKIRDYIDYSQW